MTDLSDMPNLSEPSAQLGASARAIPSRIIGAESGAVGAKLPANAAFQAPAAELDMVVWLRGDEAYAGDFSLEAEEVMQQLGIRRSRLTQIAGKELRVGRMRRGRYISPVFRLCDVEAYLSWTRATASHVKSSALLNDAAKALLEKSSGLVGRLDLAKAELSATLTKLMRQATLATVTEVEGLNLALRQEGAALTTALIASESRSAARIAGLSAQLHAAQQAQVAGQVLLQVLQRELTDLAATVRLGIGDQAADTEVAALGQRFVRTQLAALTAEIEALRAASVAAPSSPLDSAPGKRQKQSPAAARRVKELVRRERQHADKTSAKSPPLARLAQPARRRYR